MESPPNDITIDDPILSSRSGKSTFINDLFDREVASVGHDLTSMPHTTQLHPHILPFESRNRRVIVVDTPGLLDLAKDDREILRYISRWLASSYGIDMKIAGIIYVQEIIQTRVRMVKPRVDVMTTLCGPDASQNVILATTKWGDVTKQVGERRETDLRGDYGQAMMKLGSTMYRFDQTPHSARTILDHILEKQPR